MSSRALAKKVRADCKDTRKNPRGSPKARGGFSLRVQEYNRAANAYQVFASRHPKAPAIIDLFPRVKG